MAEENIYSVNNPNIIKKYIFPGNSILVLFMLDGNFIMEKSLIREVEVNKYVGIPVPFTGNDKVILNTGSLLQIKIFPEDGYYIEYNARITEIIKEEKLVTLEYPKSIIQVQRRLAFRTEVSLNTLFILKPDLVSIHKEEKDLNAFILDISLGGALIATNLKSEIHMKGVVSFSIPNSSTPLEFSFVIKRVKKLENPRSKFLFHVGIEFIAMDEVSNQKLSQYIIQKQIQNSVERNSLKF